MASSYVSFPAQPVLRAPLFQPAMAAQERMALPALNILTPRVFPSTVAKLPYPALAQPQHHHQQYHEQRALAAAMLIESPAMGAANARVPRSAPSPSPSKKRVRALPNASKSITLELLRPHFEKPLAEVAAIFGICMTLMKKICRKNGVPRWPHRQIRGLRKSIWSIEKALRCCESEAQRRSYNDHLHKQRAKLFTILKGPESPSSKAAFEQVLAEPCSPLSDVAASPANARFPSPTASSFAPLHQQVGVRQQQQPLPAGTLVLNPKAAHSPACYTPTVTRLPSIASLLVRKAEEQQPRHFQF